MKSLGEVIWNLGGLVPPTCEWTVHTVEQLLLVSRETDQEIWIQPLLDGITLPR